MTDVDEEQLIDISADTHKPSEGELQEHKDRIQQFIAEVNQRQTPDEQAAPLTRMMRLVTSSPHKQDLYNLLFDYAVDHASEHSYAYMDGNVHWRNSTDGIIYYALQQCIFEHVNGMQDPIIYYITHQSDYEKVKQILGMYCDSASYPYVLNSIRHAVQSELPPAERTKLERVGKLLLGVGEDSDMPFHTALENVYKAVKFEEYRPNVEKNTREVNLIASEIDEQTNGHPETTGSIVDLACGTGRIINELAKREYRPLIGIDASETNIQKARSADATSRVLYVEGSWTAIDLDDESVRMLYCIGRSLPHVESIWKLQEVFNEITRVMAVGGTFVFDIPNPDKGMYLKNRQRYAKVLGQLSVVPEQWRRNGRELDYIHYVVDSPDGVNFYNRYVPDEFRVTQMLTDLGYDVEVIRREPISEGSEDENIYFRAVKVRESPRRRKVQKRKHT